MLGWVGWPSFALPGPHLCSPTPCSVPLPSFLLLYTHPITPAASIPTSHMCTLQLPLLLLLQLRLCSSVASSPAATIATSCTHTLLPLPLMLLLQLRLCSFFSHCHHHCHPCAPCCLYTPSFIHLGSSTLRVVQGCSHSYMSLSIYLGSSTLGVVQVVRACWH